MRLTGSYDGIENVKDRTAEKEWLNRFSSEDSRVKALEALKLYRDAVAMLERIEREKMFTARNFWYLSSQIQSVMI